MKLENALLQKKRPDGAVEIDSSSFFAVPLPSLCLDFGNLWAKFSPKPVCYN